MKVSRTCSRVDLEYWIKIFSLPPPTNFTFYFGNDGHCFSCSKTRCCRCPLLTAAILLMLCSTGCPVLLRFKEIGNTTQYLNAQEGRNLSKFKVSAIIFRLLEQKRAFNAPLLNLKIKTYFSFLMFPTKFKTTVESST